MLQLIVWVGLCFIGALALRRQPLILVIAILVLMFLVPSIGSSVLTGQASGSLSIHAATWLIFATVVIQLLHWTEDLLGTLARHFFLFLLIMVVVGIGVLATKVDGGSGLVVLVDQVMAPVLLFLIIVSVGRQDPRLVPKLRTTLLVLAAVVSIIALIQWNTHSVLFYEESFKTQYWFTPKQNRWMGTLDQPLTLSFMLCVVGALLSAVRRLSIQLPLLALFAGGVLTTQSRVGALVFSLVAVYIVFTSRVRPFTKALLLGVMGVAGYLVYLSPLGSGLLGRLADDTGSAQAREAATLFFLDSWSKYILAGDGISSSYRVGQSAGLQTSLESSILMYSIDIGIVFALLYFGSMVVIVIRGSMSKIGRGLVLAGVLAVVIPQTYSSLATRSLAGVLVWTVLALIVVASDDHYRTVRKSSKNDGVPVTAAPAGSSS